MNLKKDEDILFLAINDSEYFGELIVRYEKKLDRYIQRISNFRKEEREDLIQDVFLSVYENILSFEKGEKFSSWIYQIAHNKTISHWRKNKKDRVEISVDENLSLVESNFWENKILDEIMAFDDGENLKNAILNLEMKYRDVLILRYWEERGYDDISEILKIPKGSVATLLNRGKKKLKKEYKKLIGE